MSRPNRITVSHSRRGTTIKATGSAAQALFEAMTGERVGPTPATPLPPKLVPFEGACTVRFEDQGQDFLEWDLDAQGVVSESRPFQTDQWGGCRVTNLPEVGRCLSYVSVHDGKTYSIRYPVARVVRRVELPSGVQSGGTGDGD